MPQSFDELLNKIVVVQLDYIDGKGNIVEKFSYYGTIISASDSLGVVVQPPDIEQQAVVTDSVARKQSHIVDGTVVADRAVVYHAVGKTFAKGQLSIAAFPLFHGSEVYLASKGAIVDTFCVEYVADMDVGPVVGTVPEVLQ